MHTCVLALGLAAAAAAAATPPSMAVATPQAAGFSSARLARLDAFLHETTNAAHGYPGAVVLIARNGHVVELRAFGHRDLARSAPMRTDSIFRIYSMTKTIATVAVLMLMEEGRLALDDPIENYLPEFAQVRVFAGGSAEAPELRAPTRAITIHDLLTHTAGFAHDGPAAVLLDRADLHGSASLRDYAEHLARVPLGADPGARFAYDGMNTETLARVVEVISGAPFDRFLQQRIFDPLHMLDSGFLVPPEKRARVADIVTSDADAQLVLATRDRSAAAPGTMLNAYPSGAGGLYSTAMDYGRFAQMLLNGGHLDGVTLLGRKTVDLMMRDHIAGIMVPPHELAAGDTFGLGGAVVADAARRGRLTSPGAFGWSGASSTYYTIDRGERLVAILLLQYLPRGEGHDLPKIQNRFFNLVYQALEPATHP